MDKVKDDLISRQATINALIREGRTVDSRYLESERIIHESDAVEAISMLSSAQKHGKWKPYYEILEETADYFVSASGYECSECGTIFHNQWDFCGNCGAVMEKADEN